MPIIFLYSHLNLAFCFFQNNSSSEVAKKDAKILLSVQDPDDGSLLGIKSMKGHVCSTISKKREFLSKFLYILAINNLLSPFLSNFLAGSGQLRHGHSECKAFLAWSCSGQGGDGADAATSQPDIQPGTRSA